VLTTAGRAAHTVGTAPAATTGKADPEAARDAAAERTDQKIEWVRAAAGERFDDLELNALVFATIVTDDRAAMAEMIGGGFGLSAEAVLEIPHALARRSRAAAPGARPGRRARRSGCACGARRRSRPSDASRAWRAAATVGARDRPDASAWIDRAAGTAAEVRPHRSHRRGAVRRVAGARSDARPRPR
jgi:hypothetical protein